MVAKFDKNECTQNNLHDTSCKQKMKTEYYCDFCQFLTTIKKDMTKHCKSNQHIQKKSSENLSLITNKYVCLVCEKKYDNYKTCWGHSKFCQGKKEKNIITKIQADSEIKKEKQKKKIIPLALRRNVWNKHIGEEIGKTLCLCCKLSNISQMNFSCGHIISETNGGEINLENLKPICVSCNSSMGTQNMDEFIKIYKL
jgi:hypothetical protein